MKHRRGKSLFVVFLLLFTSLVFLSGDSVSADWWDSGWMYRKYCPITNSLDDYAAKIVVGQDSGDGGDVHCEGDCQDDFGDIRFCDESNNTLSFWIRNMTSGVQATVFVNVSDASGINLYYGTSGTSTTTSSGEDTFLYFQDCEDETIGNAPSDDVFSVSPANNANNYIKYYTHGSYGDVLQIHSSSSDQVSQSLLVEIKDNWDLDDICMGFVFVNTVNYFYIHGYDTSGNRHMSPRINYLNRWMHYTTTSVDYNPTCPTTSANNEYNLEFQYIEDDHKIVIDDTLYDGVERSNHVGDIDYFDVFAFRKNTMDAYLDDFYLRYYNDAFSWGSWGDYQTNSGGWSNTAPTVEQESPTGTGISVTPSLSVRVNDSDGNSSTVYWQIDTDNSSWTSESINHTNTSILNMTAYFNISNDLEYETLYYVKVSANDTHDNTSVFFSFTTEAAPPEPVWYRGDGWGGFVQVNASGSLTLSSNVVTPSSGVASFTVFYFNVSWASSSGNGASSGYLKVNISRSGWSSNESMSYVSGDNSSDALYSYSTTLSAGSYSFRVYGFDGVVYDNSSVVNEPTVNSQQLSFDVNMSSDSGQFDFKQWSLVLTKVGRTTQYDNKEDNQTADVPALNVSNTGNVPLNISMFYLTSPGSGISLKYNTSNNPPSHGVNTVNVSPASTLLKENLGVGEYERFWLWMDFVDVEAGSGSKTLRIMSELYDE